MLEMSDTLRLKLIESGLSSAFAPTFEETFAKQAELRSAFFANEAFLDSNFRPQLCAFRDGRTISSFDVRATELMAEAIDDLVTRLGSSVHVDGLRGRRASLMLILPEVSENEGLTRSGLALLGEALCANIRQALAAGPGLIVEDESIRASGHAGVGSALTDALKAPRSAEGPFFLIAAVDSYNDRSRLNALNDERRLFSKTTQFGLVPGEAAGLMLLAPMQADDPGTDGIVVCGAGNAIEDVTELAEDETRFSALSDAAFAACEMALESRGTRRIAQWYSDWNNSRYRATELSFSIHRLNSFFLSDHIEPIYPALYFGDTGSASSILSVLLTMTEYIENQKQTEAHVEHGEPSDISYTLISAGSVIRGLRSVFIVSQPAW